MASKRRVAVLRPATPARLDEDWFHALGATALAQLIKDVDHDENGKTVHSGSGKNGQVEGTPR